jgi:hypothetical protein
VGTDQEEMKGLTTTGTGTEAMMIVKKMKRMVFGNTGQFMCRCMFFGNSTGLLFSI